MGIDPLQPHGPCNIHIDPVIATRKPTPTPFHKNCLMWLLRDRLFLEDATMAFVIICSTINQCPSAICISGTSNFKRNHKYYQPSVIVSLLQHWWSVKLNWGMCQTNLQDEHKVQLYLQTMLMREWQGKSVVEMWLFMITGVFYSIYPQNGVLLRMVLDNVTGDLSDTRTRYLGSRPVKLFRINMQGSEAVSFAKSLFITWTFFVASLLIECFCTLVSCWVWFYSCCIAMMLDYLSIHWVLGDDNFIMSSELCTKNLKWTLS